MDKILCVYFRDDYKDIIVDCLLEDELDVFYYFPCKQYSTTLLQSAKEKVTGRIDFGKIEVIVNDENKDRIVNKLYAMFGKKYLKMFIYDALEQ